MISGCSSIPAWWAITSNTLGTFCAMFAKVHKFTLNFVLLAGFREFLYGIASCILPHPNPISRNRQLLLVRAYLHDLLLRGAACDCEGSRLFVKGVGDVSESNPFEPHWALKHGATRRGVCVQRNLVGAAVEMK